MNTDEIQEILQEHKNHLIDCKKADSNTIYSQGYWTGAIDCIENISIELGVDLE